MRRIKTIILSVILVMAIIAVAHTKEPPAPIGCAYIISWRPVENIGYQHGTTRPIFCPNQNVWGNAYCVTHMMFPQGPITNTVD